MYLRTGLRLGSSGVVSIVGGGGKTTLMSKLAEEIIATGSQVVTTTTTRIFAAQTSIAPVHLIAEHTDEFLAELKLLIKEHPHILVTGPVNGTSDKAYGISPEFVNDIFVVGADSN